MNRLFDDRVDEVIYYEEQLSKVLKKRQKPDRIYGLRADNNRLGRLLSESRDRDDRLLGDRIASCPFSSKSEDLHFPFLVLEAKSEKASDSSSSIEAQSAFAIRALLVLQHKLKQEAEKECQCGFAPLVWFLSNKGEDWRIAAAYAGQDRYGEFYVSPSANSEWSKVP